MRTVDCAVLRLLPHEDWIDAWIAAQGERQGRVRLWPLAMPAQAPSHLPSVQTLASLGPVMRRYDLCVLPVSPVSLAWSRLALASVRAHLPVPVLALVRDLRAPAVQDLLDLGADDFLRCDADPDESAARLTRAWRRAASFAPLALAPCPAEPGVGDNVAGYATHPAARTRASRLASHAHGAAGQGAQPFRLAKAEVVTAFERQYIRDALVRSAGNIALASRAARKHRRAFWALMRKHQIDASQYRQPGLAPMAATPADPRTADEPQA